MSCATFSKNNEHLFRQLKFGTFMKIIAINRKSVNLQKELAAHVARKDNSVTQCSFNKQEGSKGQKKKTLLR